MILFDIMDMDLNGDRGTRFENGDLVMVIQ